MLDYTASESGLTDEDDLERISKKGIVVYSRHLLGTQKNIIRAGDPADIRIVQFENTRISTRWGHTSVQNTSVV